MITQLFTTRDSYVNKAINEIDGFEEMLLSLKKYMLIKGRSFKTYSCYSRNLAHLTLHFRKIPLLLSEKEIHDYLYEQLEKRNFLSESYFKQTVYSLRVLFELNNFRDRKIKLPVIKANRKLPVVLSKVEITKLINQPKLLKHRILIGLMYGCGLRIGEAVRLRLRDVDLDRQTLHIRQSKGKKDRYVPLPISIIPDLEFYINSSEITEAVFPVRMKGSEPRNLSREGITFAVKSSAKKAGIIKPVNVHTLRHTYATHLLEHGLDIVSIKELLGHSRIETTLRYLHVAQINKVNNFSPLDRLTGVSVLSGIQCQFDFGD